VPPMCWRRRRMYEQLAGKTVILTRAPEDNAELAARLRGTATQIVELPCVRTEPSDDTSALGDAVAELREDDCVVVTSRHGAEAIARYGPTRAAVAAIGEATAERLRTHGYRVAFQPSVPSGTALARELPARAGVVLLARSDRALSDLPRILRERGFTVREVVAYRTIAEAQGDVARVRAALLASPRGSVAVMFHSPSAVAGMLGAIEAPLVARASIHVTGRSTMRAVRDALGVDADVSLIEEEVTHVAHG
jgi:uroporphyrinogen-III synthase